MAKRERIALSRRPSITAEQLAAVRGGGIGTSPSVAGEEMAAAVAAIRPQDAAQ